METSLFDRSVWWAFRIIGLGFCLYGGLELLRILQTMNRDQLFATSMVALIAMALFGHFTGKQHDKTMERIQANFSKQVARADAAEMRLNFPHREIVASEPRI